MAVQIDFSVARAKFAAFVRENATDVISWVDETGADSCGETLPGEVQILAGYLDVCAPYFDLLLRQRGICLPEPK